MILNIIDDKLKKHIVISGLGSISALGHNKETVGESYYAAKVDKQVVEDLPTFPLRPESELLLQQLVNENKSFKGLDRAVLMAVYASKAAVADAGWEDQKNIGINIGSSRGATALLEHYITEFNKNGIVSPNASPVTTLGNISSWVAQYLNKNGPIVSHSVTCSTGLQAVANGFAWLKSGLADRFLVGASEAPLTPFTIAQMKAMGIYSADISSDYPCRPFNSQKQNTFVLGEGAAVFALEMLDEADLERTSAKPIIVDSIGFGIENITSKTGLSKDGQNFKLAVQNALANASDDSPVDLIITHSPGTLVGDYAELNAITSIFEGSPIPAITTTKWITGHTFGASGCLSLEYAINILTTQSYPEFPYPVSIENTKPASIQKILITAAGFGGNAMAVIVTNRIS